MNQIDNSQWLVCVHCPTYNHAPYIKEALDGFCMQDTNFPYVCVVVDDFSTDGEQAILKDYMSEYFELKKNTLSIPNETDDYLMTFAQHKKNRNCHIALYLLKYNHGHMKPRGPYYKKWDEESKYVARCEGDDYWIDEAKLQKQVDFLDAHEHYSAVASNARKISIDGRELGVFSTKPSRDLTDMGEMVRGRQFHTASIMYRRLVYHQSPVNTIAFGWDMWQWCCLMSQGPIRYENEISCVYRLGTGVTTTTSRLKWIQQQEKWENILFKTFSPEFITHNDAFSPLLADVFSVMTNKDTSKEDKEELRAIFKKYITLSLFMEMMPMMLWHFASRFKLEFMHIIKHIIIRK